MLDLNGVKHRGREGHAKPHAEPAPQVLARDSLEAHALVPPPGRHREVGGEGDHCRDAPVARGRRHDHRLLEG